MTRAITLAGYVVLAAALTVRQLSACRAQRRHREPHPVTFGEFLALARRWSHIRLLILLGWLWLGWHVFARADWQ